MKPEIFEKTIFPRKDKNLLETSEDVCTVDDKGMHGLAWYNFDTKKWSFHTDTLTDPETTMWWWYYPVVSKRDLPIQKRK